MVQMSQKQRLLIFAKYPEAGRVKTRLAKRVGAAKAAQLYRDMVTTVVAKTKPDAASFERILYYDPPERSEAFQDWLPFLQQQPQRGDDLGERMSNALEESLQTAAHTVIIGTDCIDIDSEVVTSAFAALLDHDLVLGPATDGGYYLIGCRAASPALFAGIAWSTPSVLEQTLQRAQQLELQVHLLDPLSDIDF